MSHEKRPLPHSYYFHIIFCSPVIIILWQLTCNLLEMSVNPGLHDCRAYMHVSSSTFQYRSKQVIHVEVKQIRTSRSQLSISLALIQFDTAVCSLLFLRRICLLLCSHYNVRRVAISERMHIPFDSVRFTAALRRAGPNSLQRRHVTP